MQEQNQQSPLEFISGGIHKHIYLKIAGIQTLIFRSEKSVFDLTNRLLSTKIGAASAGLLMFHVIHTSENPTFELMKMGILAGAPGAPFVYSSFRKRPTEMVGLGKKPEAILNETMLSEEMSYVIENLNQLTDTQEIDIFDDETIRMTHDSVKEFFNGLYGYSLEKQPKIKKITDQNNRMLGGIFTPQTGEISIIPQAKIDTLAHEMTHRQGVLLEAQTQFAAIIALTQSEKPILKEAGYYGWLDILMRARRGLNKFDLTTEGLIANEKEYLESIGLDSKYINRYIGFREFVYSPNNLQINQKIFGLFAKSLMKVQRIFFRERNNNFAYGVKPASFLREYRLMKDEQEPLVNP